MDAEQIRITCNGRATAATAKKRWKPCSQNATILENGVYWCVYCAPPIPQARDDIKRWAAIALAKKAVDRQARLIVDAAKTWKINPKNNRPLIDAITAHTQATALVCRLERGEK